LHEGLNCWWSWICKKLLSVIVCGITWFGTWPDKPSLARPSAQGSWWRREAQCSSKLMAHLRWYHVFSTSIMSNAKSWFFPSGSSGIRLLLLSYTLPSPLHRGRLLLLNCTLLSPLHRGHC
jgi:hypothetical protein